MADQQPRRARNAALAVVAIVVIGAGLVVLGQSEPGAGPVPTEETSEVEAPAVDTTVPAESSSTTAEPEVPEPSLAERVLDGGESCADPPAGPTIVIGVVVAGAEAPEAAEAVAAVRHLATLVECAGGVDGRSVEVVEAMVGEGVLAVRGTVEELLAAEPVAVIGPADLVVGTRVVEAVDGRAPVLFPLSVAPSFDDSERGSFLIGPDATALAAAAARYALDQGWRSAVTFSGGDPGSAVASAAFREWFERGGGVVADDVGLGSLGEGAIDPDEVAEVVGEGSTPRQPPDVLVAGLQGASLADLSAAIGSADVSVPLVAIDLRGSAGGVWSTLDGVAVIGREPAGASGLVASFDRSYRQTEGVDLVDPVAAARVADAALVVLEAVRRADDPGVEAIARELGGDWAVGGITGPVGPWPGASAWPTAEVPVVRFEGGRSTLVDRLSPLPPG